MNTTTTILSGLAGAVGVTSTTLNEDGSVNREKRNAILATATSTVAVTLGGDILNKQSKEKVHEKYSQAYVKSMSDDELIKALQDFDLLDKSSEEVPKTLRK